MAQREQTLTIPFPRPSQNVNRGFKGVEPDPMRPTTIRLSDPDRKLIDAAANSLHMTMGEFMRWCAFYCATEVNNEVKLSGFKDRREPDLTGFK